MTTVRVRSTSVYALLALAAVGTLAAGSAYAAGDAPKGPSEAIFIAEILALMITGRLLGEAMLRFGQPAIMGQLLA
ncbi:MAG: hypothetical protein WAM62_01810, partial [Pseudolabrys sp.]